MKVVSKVFVIYLFYCLNIQAQDKEIDKLGYILAKLTIQNQKDKANFCYQAILENIDNQNNNNFKNNPHWEEACRSIHPNDREYWLLQGIGILNYLSFIYEGANCYSNILLDYLHGFLFVGICTALDRKEEQLFEKNVNDQEKFGKAIKKAKEYILALKNGTNLDLRYLTKLNKELKG